VWIARGNILGEQQRKSGKGGMMANAQSGEVTSSKGSGLKRLTRNRERPKNTTLKLLGRRYRNLMKTCYFLEGGESGGGSPGE